ncbi:hypothetical protein CCY99_08345 [Helicobacter sp. 16-1353]|uniref:hypothetical protein n=1 Tax=Helicobacter sp. 16-1353 TaxID=2004996 RepID=UPI000DCCEAC2|nr:hypothetical protein [Helicobacter sp. 16-1353]RAX51800.1 hypothetical protein CCY99_08345 [Helicobacter sp. 16-1353]
MANKIAKIKPNENLGENLESTKLETYFLLAKFAVFAGILVKIGEYLVNETLNRFNVNKDNKYKLGFIGFSITLILLLINMFKIGNNIETAESNQ